MKKKQVKIVCIIFAVLIALSAAVGIVVCLYNNFGYGSGDFSALNTASSPENFVSFKSGVNVADDPKEAEKNFDSLETHNDEYTIFYKKSIPDFFRNIKNGELFCVYPDDRAKESFFAMGFCGKITEINEKSEPYSVSFTIPEFTEVFSDIHIDTRNSNSDALTLTGFRPSENVTAAPSVNYYKNTMQIAKCGSPPLSALSSSVYEDSLEIGDNTVGFKYKEPETQSLVDDYVLICDELKLNIEHKSSDNEFFTAKGTVTLEDTALKLLLDYHYDESSDTVKVNDCSMGMITKQKIDLSFSGKDSIGLDKINSLLSDKTQIIDIEDVTETEKGKIILGTYLIGWEAALPISDGKKTIAKNRINDVSYLSLGIAIQFSITAKGELSLEYKIKESGFTQIEANGKGKNKKIVRGYDYPNPVTEQRQPTEEEEQSLPGVTSEIKGEASFDAAFGGDVGICILGMVPVKQANNFLEFEITRSFTDKINEEKATPVMDNNYLLDENVDYLTLGSNSYLKMHLGAKVKLGKLKYTVAELDGKIQLMDKIWLQYPPAKGFSHSHCGFGGVFVGEAYTDEELDEAFNSYMADTNQKSILTTAKDSLLGSVVNAAINNKSISIANMSDLIGKNADDYNYSYFSSGVIYARDKSNKVVASIITGKDITNASGIHNGLSPKKIKQVYSSPDLSAEIDINIGSILKFILGIDGIENGKITESVYLSKDSKEQMSLLFCDDSLKLIIVTEKA